MLLITLQMPFYYGRASCRDILLAGISAYKASSGMAGVVVGVRVYGRVLGVKTTGKYFVYRPILLGPHGGHMTYPESPTKPLSLSLAFWRTRMLMIASSPTSNQW